MSFWEVVGTFGGLQVVLIALVGYVSNLWLQRKKAELEKVLYAHSERYKNEFETYKRLWVLFVRFDAVVKAVAQRVGELKKVGVDGQEQSDDVHEELLRDYRESLGAFRSCIDENQPFYTDEIRGKLVSYQREAEIVFGTRVNLTPEITVEVFGQELTGPPLKRLQELFAIHKRMDKLKEKPEEVCSLIRRRVGFE